MFVCLFFYLFKNDNDNNNVKFTVPIEFCVAFDVRKFSLFTEAIIAKMCEMTKNFQISKIYGSIEISHIYNLRDL